jgi:hypothetical protein
MSDIHSCSYYCDRPACIKAQRDELRDRFQVMQAPQPVVDVFDSRISPAILSFAKGEDELLVRRIWDKVRVAMLSAGKGGE